MSLTLLIRDYIAGRKSASLCSTFRDETYLLDLKLEKTRQVPALIINTTIHFSDSVDAEMPHVVDHRGEASLTLRSTNRVLYTWHTTQNITNALKSVLRRVGFVYRSLQN